MGWKALQSWGNVQHCLKEHGEVGLKKRALKQCLWSRGSGGEWQGMFFTFHPCMLVLACPM